MYNLVTVVEKSTNWTSAEISALIHAGLAVEHLLQSQPRRIVITSKLEERLETILPPGTVFEMRRVPLGKHWNR